MMQVYVLFQSEHVVLTYSWNVSSGANRYLLPVTMNRKMEKTTGQIEFSGDHNNTNKTYS